MPTKKKYNSQGVNDVIKFVKNFSKPYFVFLINKKLEVIAVNSEAVKLLNKNKKKEIEGHLLKEILDKKYFQSFASSLKSFFKDFEKNINAENKFLVSGKKEIIMDSLFIPTKDKDGEIGFAICILKDATDSEKRDENIRKSEEKYRYFFENSQNMLFGISNSAKLIEVNQTALDILGYKKEEVIGKKFRKFMPFKYVPVLLKDLVLEIAGGKAEPINIEIRHKNGKLIPVDLYPGSVPIYDKNKKVIGLMVTGRDMASKTKVEKSLEKSGERFELLFEHLSDGLAFFNPIYNKQGKMVDSEYLEVNKSYADFIGLPRTRVIGKKVSNILPGTGTSTKWFSKFDQVVKNGGTIDFEMYHKPTKKYYNVRAFRPEVNTYAALFRDVTSEKNQKTLLRFQRDLGLAFSNVNSLKETGNVVLNIIKDVKEIDGGGIYSFVDDGNLILISSQGLSNKFIKKVEKYKSNSKQAKMIRKGKKIIINYSASDLAKTDAKKEENIKALVIIPFKDKGKVVGALNVFSKHLDKFSDNTINLLDTIIPRIEGVFSRIIREEEIKFSKERYNILAETQKEGVAIINNNCVVQYINPALFRLLGYSSEEIVGKNFQNFLTTSGINDFVKEYKKDFEKGENKMAVWEVDMIKKDNRIISAEVSANSLIKNDKIDGIHLTIRDVSERKKAEKALSQKVEELEQINRLLVGRELKMVELKKKIARLERKLQE